MPLITRLGREMYDTSRIFAGLKVKRIGQGDSVHQWEAEVPCRLGVFYAVAENCVGFQSRSGQTASRIMREVPGVRVWSRSDDGSVVLHLDVELFETVAAMVGVRRRRVLSPEQRALSAERLKRARLAKSRKCPESLSNATSSEQVCPSVSKDDLWAVPSDPGYLEGA